MCRSLSCNCVATQSRGGDATINHLVCVGCDVPCRDKRWVVFVCSQGMKTWAPTPCRRLWMHCHMRACRVWVLAVRFLPSLCLRSTCCPATSAWCVWVSTHTTAAWCHVVAGLHYLVKHMVVIVLCGDVAHSVCFCVVCRVCCHNLRACVGWGILQTPASPARWCFGTLGPG